MCPVSKHGKKGKKKRKASTRERKNKVVNYICLDCDTNEEIPLTVVRDFDAMDLGDESVAPRFSCEQCGGEMYPEYYKGIHGIEYRITDVRPN
ncbi:hypothetical protein EFBL_0293 [Effusibacillus lacus]|uniref:Uncharacterized protein n=1 Tax=Effusibacillus lacus TaxID=1348429 RepID=A0A292YIH5_9BACL|nr:hypothetical protein EFBL_0293 [Effusibacillus lacus]